MLDLGITSEFLGYASIAAWLGAQFPQVIENYQRSSCEGLALPFLANWFLGDVSNLIGCVLTHQLPFQTWLATYFVFVDMSLLGQYVYYQWWTSPPPTHVKSRSGTSTTRRMSLSGHGSRPRYRTLSAVASNVAAAAALAAQQEQVREHHRQGSLVHHGHRGIDSSASLLSREMDEDEEMDHNLVNTLADSFHSEGGRNIGRKRVSWSVERYGGRGGSVGRYSQRQATLHGSDVAAEQELATSTPTVRHNSLASRQGAGLAFLSVFALFSVGQLVGSKTNTGFVVTPQVVPRSDLSPLTALSLHDHPSNAIDSHQSDPYQLSSHEDAGVSYVTVEIPANDTLKSKSEPSSERVIGRLFAWLCTTLYLTSRLPQIWKKFSRKSVEGLSVYLFIFAFLGNFFYVSSILTNPKAHQGGPLAEEFITESIPYLLGSGGTFIFDVTIVTQVIVYRNRPKSSIRRGRRHSRAGLEEESGLLAEESQEYPPYNSSVTPTHESPVHSRDRTSHRTF